MRKKNESYYMYINLRVKCIDCLEENIGKNLGDLGNVKIC